MKTLFTFKLVALVASVFALCASALAQVDVPRKTIAVTYPLDDAVTVHFRGTTRFPRMKGEAKVKRTTRSGTKIELSVDNMPRPFELGAGYATYVLWAISPTGQADNLGEIKRSGLFFINSKITVTTPLQTFAMIITAEPHFMVTRPSQAIMFENLNPVAQNGKPIGTTPAIQYFGNSSDYFRDPRTPEIAEVDYQKTPPAILQAKQAVALAKFAGAERDAPDELQEAETSLQNAINAFDAGRDSDTIDIAARRSIAAAVKAESTAGEHREAREKRNEKTRSDAEIRLAEGKYTDAQNQIADLRAELARETRNRELAERDAMNFSSQLKDLREENGRLREDLGRLRVEADTAKAQLAAIENEKVEADKAAKQKVAESELMSALKAIGPTAKTDRGIVLMLPESIWTGVRASTLSAAGGKKVDAVAKLLAGAAEYRATVESYTDSSGSPDQAQTVTDSRANLIAQKFAEVGVEESRIFAKGYGSTVPAAPNTTAANRAKNRRVQIVFATGDQN
jgi:outer membrane protein OmpA-like peptidoglycan-associated protein